MSSRDKEARIKLSAISQRDRLELEMPFDPQQMQAEA